MWIGPRLNLKCPEVQLQKKIPSVYQNLNLKAVHWHHKAATAESCTSFIVIKVDKNAWRKSGKLFELVKMTSIFSTPSSEDTYSCTQV